MGIEKKLFDQRNFTQVIERNLISTMFDSGEEL